MNSTVYFDAHCHWPATTGGASGLLGYGEGIGGMVCCGTSPDDWASLQRAATGVPGVIPAYGLHPWFVPGEAGADAAALDELARLLAADPQASVGEIGIDFVRRDGASPARQQALLDAQLQLAQRLGRVAIIHCVRAWGALVDTLAAVGPLPRGLVLHAYGGSAEMIVPLARLGAFFSFKAGDDTPSPKTVACMQVVPPERLLLESDLYLAEDGADAVVQRQRLERVAAQLAAATGMTPAQAASLTTANARRCWAHGGGVKPKARRAAGREKSNG